LCGEGAAPKAAFFRIRRLNFSTASGSIAADRAGREMMRSGAPAGDRGEPRRRQRFADSVCLDRQGDRARKSANSAD
jgi:hypothetical protein